MGKVLDRGTGYAFAAVGMGQVQGHHAAKPQ